MTTQIDSKTQLEEILNLVIADNFVHAKWLNTISYMENCGARKIAAFEHPTLVKEEVLKHASEEFRHAHYLKSQIEKVSPTSFPDYALSHVIGGIPTLNYLNNLDVKTSRYLSQTDGLTRDEMREAAYLLVTYAIEVRAEEFYPFYEEMLRKNHSKVFVKSIVLEEQEHLEEMRRGLAKIPSGFLHAENICKMENALYAKWLQAVSKELRTESHQISGRS